MLLTAALCVSEEGFRALNSQLIGWAYYFSDLEVRGSIPSWWESDRVLFSPAC